MKRWADGVFAPAPLAALPCAAADVIRALTPVVVPERLARIERAVESRIGSVIVAIDSLADPHNAAAILRTCDGLGVGEVHAIEANAAVLINTRVTKGCEKWMTLRRHSEPSACVDALRARGFTVMVADARGAAPVESLAQAPRLALAFGNEHDGVSAALRAAADGSFAIPMRGMVESFNVSVAVAIAVAAVTRARRGDLGSEEAVELKARFLMESVREPEWIIERHLHDAAAHGRS